MIVGVIGGACLVAIYFLVKFLKRNKKISIVNSRLRDVKIDQEVQELERVLDEEKSKLDVNKNEEGDS